MPTMTNHDGPRTTEPATADRDWFGGRRWTGIGAIAVLILIVLCVVLVFVIHHGDSSSGPVPAPAVAASGTSSTAGGATASAAAALPTKVPDAAPAGTQWTIYQTIALPTLVGAGPTKVTGSIATGYAHSPLGALLAVTNEGFRYGLAPDSEWRQAAGAMLAPGAGTNAWMATRAKNPYGAEGAAGSDTLLQIAGFQFVSYTPTDAVIQVVTGNPSAGYQVGADHVIWDGTDWKYVPAADGGQAANLQTIDSLAGFIEWRGV